MDIRVLHLDGGTLEDKTVDANNYYSGNSTLDIVASTDYLYFGSMFPFNHLYFKFGTVNTAGSTLTVKVWDGSTWASVKETFDSTSLSGATFGQSGYIRWSPDKNSSWGREDTQNSSGSELVTGLGDIQIYDHYWVRFSFSNNLDVGTSLSWVGNLFSNDNDLKSEYPDLVRTATMNGWSETGSKTSWEEQHVVVAGDIIRELKQRKIVYSAGQILDYKDFTRAAVSGVARIAFAGMGVAFREEVNIAQNLYEKRLQLAIDSSIIDQDLDAQVDREELGFKQGRITRGDLNRYSRSLQ